MVAVPQEIVRARRPPAFGIEREAGKVIVDEAARDRAFGRDDAQGVERRDADRLAGERAIGGLADEGDAALRVGRRGGAVAQCLAVGKIVATADALDLVAYLRSLKQIKLPDGTAPPDFLYKRSPGGGSGGSSGGASGGPAGSAEPDGRQLFTTNCQACHQANGEGLPGAFPPLKGSPIVNGEDLEKYVDIIMHGYDARAEYGVMPPVGTNAGFTEHEVAAIMNYERSSWGNNARKVTPEEIKAILSVVNLKTAK